MSDELPVNETNDPSPVTLNYKQSAENNGVLDYFEQIVQDSKEAVQKAQKRSKRMMIAAIVTVLPALLYLCLNTSSFLLEFPKEELTMTIYPKPKPERLELWQAVMLNLPGTIARFAILLFSAGLTGYFLKRHSHARNETLRNEILLRRDRMNLGSILIRLAYPENPSMIELSNRILDPAEIQNLSSNLQVTEPENEFVTPAERVARLFTK